MKDVTLSEIADEICKEFPVKIPKFIVLRLLNVALRHIYTGITESGNEFRFHKCDIVKIYEVINGPSVIGAACDVDETTVPDIDALIPVKRVDYYNILTHTTKKGEKQKKIIGYFGRRNHRH
jgi:hypothetical protein